MLENAPILKLIYLNILNPACVNAYSSYKPRLNFNNKLKFRTPQTLKPKHFKESKFPKNINKPPEKVGDFLKRAGFLIPRTLTPSKADTTFSNFLSDLSDNTISNPGYR